MTEFIIISLIKIAVVFFILLTVIAYLSIFERKILGWIQMRPGPNRVGPWGLLQPLADGIKFLFKEDLVPAAVDKVTFILAPMVAMIPALMTYAVIPFGSEIELFGRTIPLHITSINVGLLYVFALTSIGVYGIVLAGWSSNNKYSLLGGLRSSAQMISYELALALSIVGVLLQAGTLDLQQIVANQAGTFKIAGIPVLPRWHIFWFQPLGFIIFLVSANAELNRIPFDLPEAEAELVAGYHTEYSSMKFAMFYMAEYANMITASAIATTLFLGGWRGPFVDQVPILSVIYFTLKVCIFIFFFIWLRGTMPRFRYDQLMNLGWRVLLPLAFLNIFISATISLFVS